MRPARMGARILAAALAYVMAAQPALAAAGQAKAVPVVSLPVSGLMAGGAASQGLKLSLHSPLSGLSLTRTPSGLSLSARQGSSHGRAFPADRAASGGVDREPPAPKEAEAADVVYIPAVGLLPGVSASNLDAGYRTIELRLKSSVPAATVGGNENASSEDSREEADERFNALTGERNFSGFSLAVEPDSVLSPEWFHGSFGFVAPASQQEPSASQPEVPPAKRKFSQVFKDPERNQSFWRYIAGYVVFLFGVNMYTVGFPFLISAFTKNVLRENNDPRAGVPEAVQTLVRENRSLARIAHWVAQAVGYVAIPLFTRDADGSLKWLPRSFWIRSAIMGSVVALFFASGLFSLHPALYALPVLIGAASFFQAISVTLEGAGLTRVMGHKSVTDGERRKANAILTFVSSLMAIIGPAVAGQISQVRDLFGKTGAGGAVIYGIYALCAGVAGLVYATVKIFSQKSQDAAGAGKAELSAGKITFTGVFKNIWVSLRDGIKLVVKDRFLRVLLVLSLLASLFSDPLVFNVLPEYVENLIQANPGAVGAILDIPVVGWLFKGMTSTPMGFFSLLVVFSSMGSIVGAFLIDPLRNLCNRLGFKSEESLTIPFSVIAALEAALFWLMLATSSLSVVLSLYGLQSFATGFWSNVVTGLYQKRLGAYSGARINMILVAESFLGMLAAILSTWLYGFVLTGIPIGAALWIAAIALTVYAVARILTPWLSFSKAERGAPAAPNKKA